jgi:hypothetical protein
MKSVIGQSLRFGGMLIEMLGVMGIVTGRGDIESLRLRLPDGTQVSPAYIMFAVGLVIWIVGTILVTSSRRLRPKL